MCLASPCGIPCPPLFSTEDYLAMARESGVITANAMGAYTFGLLSYGPGLHAGALAFHSLTLSQPKTSKKTQRIAPARGHTDIQPGIATKIRGREHKKIALLS